MRWRYNAKLGKWFHPTSAVSDNGPDDPPAELEGNGNAARRMGLGDIVAASIKFATLGMVKPCGGCKERQRKLNEIGRKITG
jgi:hypothetical protein